jgi:hypothetical protein
MLESQIKKFSKRARKYKEHKTDFRNCLCIILNCYTDNEITIIDDKLTIRDNDIHKYNSNTNATISEIVDYIDLSDIIQENIVDNIKEVEENRVGLELHYGNFRGIYYIYKLKNENEILASKVTPLTNKNKIYFGLYRDSIFTTVQSGLSGKRSMKRSEEKWEYTMSDEKIIKELSRGRRESKLLDFTYKANSILIRKIKKYKNLKNKLSDNHSSEIVSHKLLKS